MHQPIGLGFIGVGRPHCRVKSRVSPNRTEKSLEGTIVDNVLLPR